MLAVKAVEGAASAVGAPVSTEVARWTEPLAPLTIDLHHPLPARLRSALPVAVPVLDALCDALEAVLGEYADPDGEEIDQANVQFRTVLPLLVRVADWYSGPAVTEAVDRAQTVGAEARSDGALRARGQARRLAVCVLDLVDLLVGALS